MVTEHEDFYKRLRKKVHKWARSKEGKRSEYTEYVLLAPDLFHLLVRLTLDEDVAMREKAKLGAALAYFVSPVDLLPEWLIGPIGYLDDVGLAVFVLHSVLENTDEAVVTRHWAGDKDLLETIRDFMERADKMLGSGLWGKLRAIVDPGGKGAVIKTTATKAKPTRSDAARGTEAATGTTDVAGAPKAAKTSTGKDTTRKKAAKKAAAEGPSGSKATKKPAKKAEEDDTES